MSTDDELFPEDGDQVPFEIGQPKGGIVPIETSEEQFFAVSGTWVWSGRDPRTAHMDRVLDEGHAQPADELCFRVSGAGRIEPHRLGYTDLVRMNGPTALVSVKGSAALTVSAPNGKPNPGAWLLLRLEAVGVAGAPLVVVPLRGTL